MPYAGEQITYGSDLMVELIRKLDIPFVAMNPGASFRGLHESLVNFGPGQPPHVIECTHEEISVAVAHGYAKAAGKPMMAALHNVVGLQHAGMAIFNAWCDRVPIMMVGGGGPMDVAKRRPWIEWIHTALVQGNIVRDIVKWDDQPYSLHSLADSFYRAYRLAVTEPAGPVYVCLDAALQEDPIGDVDVSELLPDPLYFSSGSSPAPDPQALRKIAGAIQNADWPVIIADHVGRSEAGFHALAELADRWAIAVIDRYGRLNLPTDHPMNLSGDNSAVLAKADVILSLDVRDLFGTLSAIDRVNRTTSPLISNAVRVFAIGVQDYGVRSLTTDFQRLYPTEGSILADTKLALPMLNEILSASSDPAQNAKISARKQEIPDWHHRLREQWSQKANESRSKTPIATAALAAELWELLNGRKFVLANGDLEGWTHKIFTMDQPRQYLGPSGGAGLGYGIGATIGACLAHEDDHTLVVNIQSDGDFMFTPGGLWTLAHHKLPALNVMFNNRSYYNSQEHQMNTARRRGRDVIRATLGTTLDQPAIDFAKMADSMGVVGIGPIYQTSEIAPALQSALRVIEEQHRPVLVDVVTENR